MFVGINANKLPVLELKHRYFRSTKHVFIGAGFGVVIYELVNLIKPEYGELHPLFEGDLWAYFKDVLGYYYLFEVVSIFLFFRLSLLYFKVFDLNEMQISWKSFGYHLLKCMPLIILSIFIFVPITNGFRFLIYEFPDYTWTAYFPKYFMHNDLYVLYLIPLLIFGLGFIIFNIFEDYSDFQLAKVELLENQVAEIEANASTKNESKVILGSDQKEEYPIRLSDIWWFEIENRNFFAFTQGKTFQIKKTLTELENELPENDFFRINRAVIINMNCMKNYQYWENDKYKIRLKDDKTEFIIQRKRLNELKKKLNLK